MGFFAAGLGVSANYLLERRFGDRRGAVCRRANAQRLHKIAAVYGKIAAVYERIAAVYRL
jgi:hypothetical protein